MDEVTENWTMKELLHWTLRLRNSQIGEQIQNGRRMKLQEIQLPLDMALHCSVFSFLVFVSSLKKALVYLF